MVTLRLTFWETVKLSFKVATHTLPQQYTRVLISPHLCQLLFFFCLFDYSHPSESTVSYHWGFDMSFPNGKWYWAFFSCIHSLIVYSLWRNAHLTISLIFNCIVFLLLSCKSSLYILEIILLTDKSSTTRTCLLRPSPVIPLLPCDKLQVTDLDFVRWIINFL